MEVKNTMKKLFLSSSFKDVASLFENFEKDLKGKTVTFIPTASVVETVKFYVRCGKEELERMGMIVEELEVSTAPIELIKTTLEKNDYIYVSGGNTFFLLQELKRTGADKIIIDQVNNGKLYIGESAGAIITSVNVEYAKEMDSIKKAPKLKEYTELNLVDFCTVPHFTNFPFRKSAKKIVSLYSDKFNLVTISNNEAILVDNGEKEIKAT